MSRRPCATASPASALATRAACSGVLSERELRREHGRVRAARAVGGAVRVALPLDLHHLAAGVRQEQIARPLAVPAGEDDDPRTEREH